MLLCGVWLAWSYEVDMTITERSPEDSGRSMLLRYLLCFDMEETGSNNETEKSPNYLTRRMPE